MKDIKFKTNELCVIKWRDAFHPEHCNWWGMEELEEFVKSTEFIAWNVGVIVHEDKEFYTIASMVAEDGKSISHIQRIPKGCVIEIKKLKYQLQTHLDCGKI